MKLCKVSELVGGEILARPVMTPNFQVLLSEETKLQADYIRKLQELEIQEVYIHDETTIHLEEVVILKSEIEESFKNKVKDILEKHTYSNSQELAQLSSTADNIITNILEEKEVVERIFDIKERSSDIYEHSISICTLATLTALKLGLSQGEVHDIGVSCLLHDLGLRYLTIEYNNQDINKLSDLEIAEYRKHPVYANSALKDENWISKESKEMILYHHERLDGSGFPLHAREIPLNARIVAVCDAFDEMICGIGCERVKVYEAIEFLKTFTNSQFDKQVVDIFLEFTAVYPAGSYVLTNEGETGVVLRQNKEFPNRPVIKVIKDKRGKELREERILDLIKVNHIFIDKVLE